MTRRSKLEAWLPLITWIASFALVALYGLGAFGDSRGQMAVQWAIVVLFSVVVFGNLLRRFFDWIRR